MGNIRIQNDCEMHIISQLLIQLNAKSAKNLTVSVKIDSYHWISGRLIWLGEDAMIIPGHGGWAGIGFYEFDLCYDLFILLPRMLF